MTAVAHSRTPPRRSKAGGYALITPELITQGERMYGAGRLPEYIAGKLKVPLAKVLSWKLEYQWRRDAHTNCHVHFQQGRGRPPAPRRLVGLPIQHDPLPSCRRTDRHQEAECGLYRHQDLDEIERRRLQRMDENHQGSPEQRRRTWAKRLALQGFPLEDILARLHGNISEEQLQEWAKEDGYLQQLEENE